MSVWRGARLPAVKVLLYARCSDLGFFKRLPGMRLVAQPLDAHNRQSRAFFDWFVDGAFRGGRPSLLQRDRPSMHGPLLW